MQDDASGKILAAQFFYSETAHAKSGVESPHST